MEVKNKKPRLVRDFWPIYKRGVTLAVVVLPIIPAVTAILSFYITGFFESHMIIAISLVLAILVVGFASAFWIARLASTPLKALLDALVHVSGEPSATPPPNPNEPNYQNNGFREALQTIYQLASDESNPQPITGEVTPGDKNRPIDLASALDITKQGLIVLGSDRGIVYANKSAPVATTKDGETVIDLMFNGSDNLNQWLDQREETDVRAEHVWPRIANRVAGDDEQRIFDVMVSYEKGAAYETVISTIDRTEHYRRDEDDLNFIAFAAHELRGPITVIRGYLDVLQGELEESLKDDHEELFRRLVVSSNRLSGYINNILNTSRYDRRHLKVNLVEDTVSGVYDTIDDDMQLRASSQHRLLAVNIPQNLPAIAADRASLSEVFGNLIDNAIKYSNEGGVIKVNAEAKGDFIEISVEDNGIGMPGNVVKNLFQKFYRSHRSRETVAGTGIGLYISKAIVESHGGTISVRSAEGKGSTFIVSLPTYASVAEKLQASNSSNEELISHGSGWIKNHSMYRG